MVNSATWTADQGVQDALTGFPLTHVTGTPTTGQYSVAAGVYTFAAADTGKAVLISYNYSTTTTGFSLAIGNPLLGPTQTFGLNVMCTDPVTNKVGTYQIYNAVISKFAHGDQALRLRHARIRLRGVRLRQQSIRPVELPRPGLTRRERRASKSAAGGNVWL